MLTDADSVDTCKLCFYNSETGYFEACSYEHQEQYLKALKEAADKAWEQVHGKS